MARALSVSYRSLVVIGAALLLHSTLSQTASSPSSSTNAVVSRFSTMDGAFTANWSIVTGFDLMEFSISAQTTGWVAIGFSANPRGHLNTGAVVAWVANGKTTIIDTTSLNQRTTPKPNTFLQTMVISGTEQDGRTTVRFRRPIKGTPGSQLIPLTSSMYLIWAYGDADGTLASSYPQHSTTTRGFAQVNFLATGQVVWGDTTTSASYLFGIVTEPGAAMTVIVAFCIVILAIVQDTHRFLKRCRESQRRRAFRGFAGIDGFAAAASKPSGGVAPAALATPPAAAIATPAAALPSGTFDSDAFRLQTESIADKAAGAELSARSVSDSDMGSSLADYPAESMELNVVPSGGFFRGSQPVPYRTGALPSPAGRTGPGLSDPPAVFDVFIHRHKSISSANKNAFLRLWRQRLFGTDITVSEVVVFGAYVMLNLILVAAWPRKMSSIDPATAIGYMAAANAFWTAVPGTRNSAISLLLWAPVDKTIRYHRWIGRFMILLGLIHGVWELALQTPDINQLIGVISGNRINLTGSVTMMFALIILLSSLESIRRHLFQLFFYTHFVFFLFYLHLWIHTAASRPYIIAAAVVYGLDRALRMIRANLIPFRATEVQTLPGNVVRIRFPKRRWAMYTAGQYVFVNFPAIAPLEWHPFSLSSGPKDDYCEIHVKALGNTTRALFKSIQGSLSIIAPLMRVEGPYGHLSSRYERYSDVILIGGGVGVTPLISIIKDIYQLDMSQAAKARFPKSALIKRVYLVWSVPTEFEWAWFAETLVKARVLAALSNYPRLTIAGHITKQKSTADPSLIVGRPDLETVFRFVESGMIAGNTVQYQQIAQNPFGDSVAVNSDQVQGRAAVYACGPRQMVAEAWDISRRRTRRKIRFDFHHEIFEF